MIETGLIDKMAGLKLHFRQNWTLSDAKFLFSVRLREKINKE